MLQESEFIKLFHAGDNTTWTQIRAENLLPLSRYVKRFTTVREEKEDIISNAFAGLWKNRFSITERKWIRPYLFVSVRNGGIKYLNKNKQQRLLQNELSKQSGIGTTHQQEQKIANIITYMMPLFDQLPEMSRKVLLLHYLEELTDQEIANELKTTIDTVYTKKSAGKKLLRQLIINNKSNLDPNLFFICLLLLGDIFTGN